MKNLLRLLVCSVLLSLPVFAQKLAFDSSFAPNLNGRVDFLEILSDGKMLIGGNFTSVNGLTRNKIARLNADGSLDTSFNANSAFDAGSTIYSMEILSDGKILLGGDFGAGQPPEYRKVVVRLNADGSFDNTLTSFPQILGGRLYGYNIRVNKAEQLPSGKILICGLFLMANGNHKPKLARYNSDGSFDPTFTTAIFNDDLNNDCRDIESQPDGKYFISGAYTSVNGSPRAGLTRFNADDTVDTTFNVAPAPGSATSDYSGLELFSDGTMIVSQSTSQPLVRVGSRLDAGGNLLTVYDENMSASSDYLRTVTDAAFQSNGKVYIMDGSRPILYRYNTDGSRDASQNKLYFSGNDFAHKMKVVKVLPDGKVIVGGHFSYFVPDLGTDHTQINQAHLARFTPQAIPIKKKYDFDGDGRDDIAVFRPSDRVWYLNRSTNGFYAAQFGLSQDKPVTADYDGDDRADIAVFRDGVWYWLRSSDSVFAYAVMGQAGDIPLAGEFYLNSTVNGLIVYRPSDGNFYVEQPFYNPAPVSIYGVQPMPGDKPLLADFDGDGKNNIAIFRGGHWFIKIVGNITTHYQFGLAGDKPVIGDFDGDLRTDYAVFRPSNGVWYIQKSTEGFYAVHWGLADDLPVPADYDGDGKTDIAVYRDGIWYILQSTGSYRIEQFGLAGDIPVQLR